MRAAINEDETEPTIETWSPLAAVTNRLLHNARITPVIVSAATEKSPERRGTDEIDSGAHGGRQQAHEERNEDNSEYIERRLRDLAAFERRAAGHVPWPRKGNRRN